MASEFTILKNPLVGYFNLFQGKQDRSGDYPYDRARNFFAGKFECNFFSNGEKTIMDERDFGKRLQEFKENFERGHFESFIVIIQCHASWHGHIALPGGRSLCRLSQLIRYKLEWAKDIPKFIVIDFFEDPIEGKDKLEECFRQIKRVEELVNAPLCLALSASKTHRFIDEFITTQGSRKQSYCFINPALKTKSTRLMILKKCHVPSDLNFAIKRRHSIHFENGESGSRTNDDKRASESPPVTPNPNGCKKKLPFEKKPVKKWSPSDVNDWIGSFPDDLQREIKRVFYSQNGVSWHPIDWQSYVEFYSLPKAIRRDLAERISRDKIQNVHGVKLNDDSKSKDTFASVEGPLRLSNGGMNESASIPTTQMGQTLESSKVFENPLVGYFSLFQGKQGRFGDYPDERARQYFSGKLGYDFFTNGANTIMDDWDFKKRLNEFKENFKAGTFDSLIVIIQCHSSATGHISRPCGRKVCTLSELIRDKLVWTKDIPKFIVIDFCEDPISGKDKSNLCLQRIKKAEEPVNPPLCLVLSASKTHRFIDELIEKHGSEKQPLFSINLALKEKSTRLMILKKYHAPSDLKLAIKRRDPIPFENGENDSKSNRKEKEKVTQSTSPAAKPNGIKANVLVNVKTGVQPDSQKTESGTTPRVSRDELEEKPERKKNDDPKSNDTLHSAVKKEGGIPFSQNTTNKTTLATPIITDGEGEEGEGKMNVDFRTKSVKKWSQDDINDWIGSLSGEAEKNLHQLRDAGNFVEDGHALLKFDWQKNVPRSDTRRKIIADLREYGYHKVTPKGSDSSLDAFKKEWGGKSIEISSSWLDSMSPEEIKSLTVVFRAHSPTIITPNPFEKKDVNKWDHFFLQQWIKSVPLEIKQVFDRIGFQNLRNGTAFLSALQQMVPSSNHSSNSTPRESTLKGVRGLFNQGNTCYMNSALQALLNVRPFIQSCLKGGIITLPGHKYNGMTHEWIQLVNEIHSGSHTDYWSRSDSVTPKGISKELRKISRDFDRNQQEDCYRVISIILSTIHEEITGSVSSKIKKIVRPHKSAGWTDEMYPQFAKLFWNQIMEQNASLIIRLFDGIECEVTTCLECGQSTRHFHLYRGLDLPVTTRENDADLASKIQSEYSESKSSPELNSLMASEQIQFKSKAMFKGQVYDLSVLSIPRSNIPRQVVKSIRECLETNFNVKLNKSHSIELVLMDRKMKRDPLVGKVPNRSEFSGVITRSVNESILKETMKRDSPFQLVALIAESSKKSETHHDYSYWNVVLVNPLDRKWFHQFNPSLVIPIHRSSDDTGAQLIRYVWNQIPPKMKVEAFGKSQSYYRDLSIHLNEQWIGYHPYRHNQTSYLDDNQGTMYLCFGPWDPKEEIIAKIKQIIDKVNTTRLNKSSSWVGKNPSQRFHSLVIRGGSIFDLPTLEIEWPKNPGKSVCMAIQNQIKLKGSQKIDLLWMDMKDSSNFCQIVTGSLTHKQLNKSLDPASSNHRLIANIWSPAVFVEESDVIHLNVIVCEIGVETPRSHPIFVAKLKENVGNFEQMVINQMPKEVFSLRDDRTPMCLYTVKKSGWATQRKSLQSAMDTKTIYAVFDPSGRFYSYQVESCIKNTVDSISDQINLVSSHQKTTHSSTILPREVPKEFQLKNLNDCLDAFEYTQVMGQDRRTYDCGVCKKRSKCVSWKKMLLTYPKILMIHFDRFKQYGKKDHLISYPLKLNRWNMEYTLVSVCKHLGHTVHSGHYTALVRAMHDQQWRLMDDSRVSTAFRGNPSPSKNAVVLIYVRS